MKDVTLAKMVNLKRTKSLFIPANWIETFNEENHKYAIFLKNNPTMFRFIPTKTDTIVQFHMKLSVLAEDFLQSLFKVFEIINREFNIKPLYSSGVCFVEEECYYFFLIEQTTDEIQEIIKKQLIILDSIEDISITNYQI